MHDHAKTQLGFSASCHSIAEDCRECALQSRFPGKDRGPPFGTNLVDKENETAGWLCVEKAPRNLCQNGQIHPDTTSDPATFAEIP